MNEQTSNKVYIALFLVFVSLLIYCVYTVILLYKVSNYNLTLLFYLVVTLHLPLELLTL